MEAQRTVQWAVVPAGGLGTRMQPVSRFIPKEMLPLGLRPMIQYALEEALQAGIRRIAVVVSPQKPLLCEFLKDYQQRRKDGRFDLELVCQPSPLGLADAIGRCRDMVECRPFAVLLPDNAIFSPHYRLSSLIDLYGEREQDVMGVIELGDGQSGLYGNCGKIDCRTERPGVLAIERLYGKGKGQLEIPQGQKLLRTCGRYVAAPWFFEYMDRVRPGRGEFDEVPVYQRIIEEKGATGCLIPPPLFDTGNQRGYLAANAYLFEQELGVSRKAAR